MRLLESLSRNSINKLLFKVRTDVFNLVIDPVKKKRGVRMLRLLGCLSDHLVTSNVYVPLS